MHMHKRKTAADLNEDIKVGEGDETISDWNHGFDVVDEIDESSGKYRRGTRVCQRGVGTRTTSRPCFAYRFQRDLEYATLESSRP
jgi:hypothetical protein